MMKLAEAQDMTDAQRGTMDDHDHDAVKTMTIFLMQRTEAVTADSVLQKRRELGFVFDADRMWDGDDSSDGRTSKLIGDAWVDFAYGQAPWTKFGDGQTLRIFKENGQADESSLKSHKTAQLGFWDALVTKRAQANA